MIIFNYYLYFLSLTSIATIVPISFGGFGVREGSFVYFLSLMDVPKDKLDKFIINFKNSMKLMDFDKIAMPTSVKGIKKYRDTEGEIFNTYKLYHGFDTKCRTFYHISFKGGSGHGSTFIYRLSI